MTGAWCKAGTGLEITPNIWVSFGQPSIQIGSPLSIYYLHQYISGTDGMRLSY